MKRISVAYLNRRPRRLGLPSFLLLVAAAVAAPLSAAPTINSIANAASNIGFFSPVAQGAVFVIKGSGLGPSNLSVSQTPFQNTSLSGTSVSVTLGATTVSALMYYTSAGQVAALLPSNTPTGPATFTVTYNGQASNPLQHTVTGSNLGILTLDSSGEGPAILTYPDYGLVSAAKAANCGGPNTACGAANPGDTITLWGTGLGPVSGNDASGAGLGQNMPNVPLTVWVGGIKAQVAYQGRSGCCVGLDQIVFTVPANAPTGCAVPLVVQISGLSSNSTVIPVANGSRDCTPNDAAEASVPAEQAVMAGPVTFADIELGKFGSNSGGFEDEADFTFAKFLGYNAGTPPFFLSWADEQPAGTCTVYAHLNGTLNIPVSNNNLAPLDAGSSFTVSGPNGSVPVKGNPGEFMGSLSSGATFLVPGAYTVTGNGGADVGPFTASITIPPSLTLVSPGNNATITRSNGMTITWNGGSASGNVLIRVYSAVTNAFTAGSKARCIVPASAGTFTIPPYVMQALPPGNFAGFTIAPANGTVPFTASGISLGELRINFDGTGFGYGSNVPNTGITLQ